MHLNHRFCGICQFFFGLKTCGNNYNLGYYTFCNIPKTSGNIFQDNFFFFLPQVAELTSGSSTIQFKDCFCLDDWHLIEQRFFFLFNSGNWVIVGPVTSSCCSCLLCQWRYFSMFYCSVKSALHTETITDVDDCEVYKDRSIL